MKKIISLLLAFVCMFGVVGCSDGGANAQYAKRPKHVKVVYFAGGYGEEWMPAVAKYYMDNVDTETYVEIKHTVLPTEEGQKVITGLSEGDVVMVSYAMFRSSGYLHDLTDLYTTVKIQGEDKTLGEKMQATNREYYNENGKYYQVPYGSNSGYSFAYNKTTLDDAFGEGNYILPRTTDEMFEFGNALKTKNTYLTSLALYDSTDYLQYGIFVWLAQMLGYDVRENLLDGKWQNAQGEFIFQEDSSFLADEKIRNAVVSTWEVIKKLCTKANGYAHADSNSMRFMDAQASLCGLGFGDNRRKVAMMFNGPWLELEMEYLNVEAEAVLGERQELRMMKMPVMSDIITRLDTVKDDQTLRAVISYVDGEGELPQGVSQSDVDIVREARNMIGMNRVGGAVVPSTAKNVQGAKDFLRYLASDKAQEVSLEATNGLVILPYGKYTTENVQITPFTQDVLNMVEDVKIVDWANLHKAFYATAGLNLLYSGINGQWVANMFANFYQDTPEQLYQKMYSYYSAPNKWQSMVQAYRDAIKT